MACIGSGENGELAVDRVAEENRVGWIPEGEVVEEAFFVGIGEEQGPMGAGVGGFIDARFCAVAAAEEIGGIGVKGFDVAEIERLRASNGTTLPVFAAVGCSEESAFGAAGPDDLRRYDVQASQARRCVGLLGDPVGAKDGQLE